MFCDLGSEIFQASRRVVAHSEVASSDVANSDVANSDVARSVITRSDNHMTETPRAV